MVKDDGKQWLLELTQSITSQLKADRNEINSIWETIRRNGESHNTCREHIITRMAEMDKELAKKVSELDTRIQITVFKVGLMASCIIVIGQYLLNHILGK